MEPQGNSLDLDIYLNLYHIAQTHKYQSPKHELFSKKSMKKLKSTLSHSVNETDHILKRTNKKQMKI